MNLKFTDKKLKCKDCEQEFVFTAKEQEIFLQRQFDVPKRCFNCRKAKRKAWKERRKNFIETLKRADIVNAVEAVKIIPAKAK